MHYLHLLSASASTVNNWCTYIYANKTPT